MKKRQMHLSDLQLLMFADHELPKAEYHQLWGHLKGCHLCRAKMLALEADLEDLIPPQLTNHYRSKDYLESRASLIRKMEAAKTEKRSSEVVNSPLEIPL